MHGGHGLLWYIVIVDVPQSLNVESDLFVDAVKLVEIFKRGQRSQAVRDTGGVIIGETVVTPSLEVLSHEVTTGVVESAEDETPEVGGYDEILPLSMLGSHTKVEGVNIGLHDSDRGVPELVTGTWGKIVSR